LTEKSHYPVNIVSGAILVYRTSKHLETSYSKVKTKDLKTSLTTKIGGHRFQWKPTNHWKPKNPIRFWFQSQISNFIDKIWLANRFSIYKFQISKKLMNNNWFYWLAGRFFWFITRFFWFSNFQNFSNFDFLIQMISFW
jgi:hypothetical protein